MTEKIKQTEQLINELIKVLEIDKKVPEEHIKDTPKRIAKMLINEVFSSLYKDPPEITTFEIDEKTEDNVVLVKNMEVRSMCAHHWMPFYGYAHIAYIPNKRIPGLSKFARIVDYFGRKPQVQEELSKEIVNYLNEKIQPKAIGIYMSCVHMCMRHRGVESDNSITDTLYVIGDEQYKPKVEKILLTNAHKIEL